MMTKSPLLPDRFEDLEAFAETWAKACEADRNRARRTSTMPALTAFYDAMLPRMRDIIAYLNTRPIDQLDERETRLLHMAFSFMEAAMAVEVFKEPDESDAFPAERYLIREARIL